MYYTENMQTGKQDRTVYQNGDVLQDKETGELFQLTMVLRSPYTSDYLLCNDSRCLNRFKSSLDLDYNCIGNIAPNHNLTDFLYACIASLPKEQGRLFESQMDEISQSVADLKEAIDEAELLREQLKEVEKCIEARANHLINVQSLTYKKIQEIREG